MDPIYCTYNSTRTKARKHQSGSTKQNGQEVNRRPVEYCWIGQGITDDDTNGATGGYLFPLIQTYEPTCAQCSYNNKGKGTWSKMCEQIVDNEYLLLFDYESPTTPHYMMYNTSNFFNVKDYLKLTKGNKGFTAAIYLNLYYGEYDRPTDQSFLAPPSFFLTDPPSAVPLLD